jgi:arylsulfatase A-like enzyme
MTAKLLPTILKLALTCVLIVPGIASAQSPTPAAGKKPNIVIIWGDDIGQSDVSAYSMGLMGFHTPNIDRVAHEGVMFTDYYAEQSCTAGRASFITGQCGLRTGNTTVGMPGATQGLQARDVTIAQLLKAQGYATGQFGKNHLGDRNEFLPTVHGFDEFYGALYHLNASEEPELPDYPKDPAFIAKFGPRGVLECKATTVDDPTVDPRFGKVGKQTIKDTGPLTRKRMETIDDDIAARAVDFIQRQNSAGKPASSIRFHKQPNRRRRLSSMWSTSCMTAPLPMTCGSSSRSTASCRRSRGWNGTRQ